MELVVIKVRVAEVLLGLVEVVVVVVVVDEITETMDITVANT